MKKLMISISMAILFSCTSSSINRDITSNDGYIINREVIQKIYGVTIDDDINTGFYKKKNRYEYITVHDGYVYFINISNEGIPISSGRVLVDDIEIR